VDTCPRLIAGCQIKNKGISYDDYGTDPTREFRVSGSMNKNGPWEVLVEEELEDTRDKAASLLNFTFEEPVEIQFIKFEMVSMWGSFGGLEYFAAIPFDCNLRSWTEWTGCCNGEKKRTRGKRCPDKFSEIMSCTFNPSQDNEILFSTIGVLSLLLILQTVGVAVVIYKVKSSARKAIKKDINPLYGVDFEGEEGEDKNLRSRSLEQSYDYGKLA